MIQCNTMNTYFFYQRCYFPGAFLDVSWMHGHPAVAMSWSKRQHDEADQEERKGIGANTTFRSAQTNDGLCIDFIFGMADALSRQHRHSTRYILFDGIINKHYRTPVAK